MGHGPYQVSPYQVSPYQVSPYQVSPYQVSPYRFGTCRDVGGRFAGFSDLQPMDAEGAISGWKGSRAKGFDPLDERVAVSWKAFEKRSRNAPANACLGLAASSPSSRRNA